MSKPKICGIYRITSPKGRIYIGQSIDIVVRWSSYKKLKCDNQIRLLNSLKKYGWEKHKFEIICQCDRKELDELEIYYISLYQCFNTEFGLNLKSGGGNGIASSETIQRMKLAMKGEKNPFYGKKHTTETREILRQHKLGKTLSDDRRLQMSKSAKGRTHSPETRIKLSNINKGNKNWLGKKHTNSTKQKMIKSCHLSKIVLHTETGIFYDSAKEVSDLFGIKHSTLRCNLNGSSRNKTNFMYV